MKALVDGVKSGATPAGVLDLRSPERIEQLRRRQEMVAAAPSGGGRLDGFRLQPAAATAAVAAAPALPTQIYSGRSWAWLRYALVGLVLVPSLAVGARAWLNRPTTPAQTATQAQPVPAAVAQPAPVESPKPVAPPTDAKLQGLLDGFRASQKANYGLWVKNLSTGQVTAAGAEQVMTSASLYKLFVALETLKRVDAGTWSLTMPVGGGTSRSIQSCLEVMINVSDNACGHVLGTKLGWGSRNQALKEAGFVGTNLATPQKTNAADVGNFLDKLQSGQLLSPASTQLLTGWLKAQKVNNRLPQGLPAGTTMAHKTGDLNGYIHDAGIVFGPKANYIVVVMGAPGAVPSQFAKLSQQLWQHFEQ